MGWGVRGIPREIPRPAGENAELRDDAERMDSQAQDQIALPIKYRPPLPEPILRPDTVFMRVLARFLQSASDFAHFPPPGLPEIAFGQACQ